jgi:hypothetical protein
MPNEHDSRRVDERLGSFQATFNIRLQVFDVVHKRFAVAGSGEDETARAHYAGIGRNQKDDRPRIAASGPAISPRNANRWPKRATEWSDVVCVLLPRRQTQGRDREEHSEEKHAAD